MDRVYRRADGTYYRETEGSGPEHHDDLQVTPGSVEAKEAGAPEPEVSGALFVPETKQVPAPAPNTHGYLVMYPTGMVAGGTLPGAEGYRHACEHASDVGGLVLAVPVARDFRR